MITGRTRVAAVIGHPVRHTLSPVLMNTAFASAGLDLVYAAFDVAPGEADAAMQAMRTLGLAGMNVTMPHKQQVFASVDELDPAALALGAVNCVVPVGGGRLRGHNTDGAGFIDSLRLDAGFDPAGRRVAVVGAGGAARAIIDAIARAGARTVVVVNRTRTSAETAAALAGPVGRVGGPTDLTGAELIVNATSVGMGTLELPFDPAHLHTGQLVADIVYHPLRTALLEAAEAQGAHTLDGLGMLVHQAARAVELWTGIRPDHVAMRAAAEAELTARAAT
jgi:shikimate dehydrogenase